MHTSDILKTIVFDYKLSKYSWKSYAVFEYGKVKVKVNVDLYSASS